MCCGILATPMLPNKARNELLSDDPRNEDMVQFMDGEPNLDKLAFEGDEDRRLVVLNDLIAQTKPKRA